MTDRAAAGRYARALFDVGLKERHEPATIERELRDFVALLRAHTELERALVSPTVSTQAKRSVVAALLERVPDMLPVTSRLLLLLAERDRVGLVGDLLEAYRARVMEHQQQLRAQVTTAVPLPADRREALARRLSEATGKRVTVEAHVDPTILGGVVAKIGSTVYDGSVTQQLERMRAQLAGDG